MGNCNCGSNCKDKNVLIQDLKNEIIMLKSKNSRLEEELKQRNNCSNSFSNTYNKNEEVSEYEEALINNDEFLNDYNNAYEELSNNAE